MDNPKILSLSHSSITIVFSSYINLFLVNYQKQLNYFYKGNLSISNQLWHKWVLDTFYHGIWLYIDIFSKKLNIKSGQKWINYYLDYYGKSALLFVMKASKTKWWVGNCFSKLKLYTFNSAEKCFPFKFDVPWFL